MKKFKELKNYIKYMPKKLLAIFVLSLAVVLPATLQAGFAPDRQVWDYSDPDQQWGPSNHPTFNSFINAPFYSDERTFFDAQGPAHAGTNDFFDPLNGVKPGDELVLRTFVHNISDPRVNGENLDGVVVSHNTKVRIDLPEGLRANQQATSYISSDNAAPGIVSDTVDINGAIPFGLEYVPGSAWADSHHATNMKVNDSVVTDGALIGYEQSNGIVPACFEYQILVYIKVKVTQPDLEFGKRVRMKGDTEWVSSVNAKPGDHVEWLLDWINDGSGVVNNVAVRDQLPQHVTLVPGSVRFFAPGQPDEGVLQNDEPLFVSGGINVGNYGQNGGGYLMFETTVNPANSFTECQVSIVNTAWSRADEVPDEVMAQAKANITIRENCETEPPIIPPTNPPSNPPKPPVKGELPNTGPMSTLAGILGSGGLGVAIRSYFVSRRKLSSALLDV
jgi:uncharacterized repeat protein (TIGR01451 family)